MRKSSHAGKGTKALLTRKATYFQPYLHKEQTLISLLMLWIGWSGWRGRKVGVGSNKWGKTDVTKGWKLRWKRWFWFSVAGLKLGKIEEGFLDICDLWPFHTVKVSHYRRNAYIFRWKGRRISGESNRLHKITGRKLFLAVILTCKAQETMWPLTSPTRSLGQHMSKWHMYSLNSSLLSISWCQKFKKNHALWPTTVTLWPTVPILPLVMNT